ncbi:aprataxin and PNK-like factor [Vanessa cardui]|uniref:aprataxin and PNK-like factor n=1 Tax=Vanessa cardui TaxID=171605 RepID=UPI001F12EDAF|nr:aprataxin and PNK-like factor [Vanessa cardui]
MTIKLVRIDASNCTKVQLVHGEHIVGRGKLLDCNDKRISREHGELLVDDKTITIKALHLNPCFFKLKDSKAIEILNLGSSKTLNSGDRFGLLPEDFWYEVIYCPDGDDSKTESEKNTEEYALTETVSSESNTLNLNKVNTDSSGVSNCNNDDTHNNSRPESPSLLSTHNENTLQINQHITGLVQPEVSESNLSNSQNKSNEEEINNDEESNKKSPTIKRSHSAESFDVKKVKTENVTVKVDPDDVKPGPSVLAVIIFLIRWADANKNDGAAKDKPNRPRERCIYGVNCYRRNPQHLSQFSHPRDADWGAGERGACPYGAACRKPDPRHWRCHDHPPGTLPPPPPGQKKRQKKNVPDVLPVQNIVTGKRIRKTVQKENWCDTGSDSEPDPFGTDESDEWEPGSIDYSEDV